MLIGELARRSGTTAKTLRFYESEGLLPPPARTTSGYRDYPDTALGRVGFVREARAAGFTLVQIRQILDIRDGGTAPCEHVGTVVAQRLREVEERITELRRTRRQLQVLARRTTEVDPADCHGYCDIIGPVH